MEFTSVQRWQHKQLGCNGVWGTGNSGTKKGTLCRLVCKTVGARAPIVPLALSPLHHFLTNKAKTNWPEMRENWLIKFPTIGCSVEVTQHVGNIKPRTQKLAVQEHFHKTNCLL